MKFPHLLQARLHTLHCASQDTLGQVSFGTPSSSAGLEGEKGKDSAGQSMEIGRLNYSSLKAIQSLRKMQFQAELTQNLMT